MDPNLQRCSLLRWLQLPLTTRSALNNSNFFAASKPDANFGSIKTLFNTCSLHKTNLASIASQENVFPSQVTVSGKSKQASKPTHVLVTR